MKSIVKNIFTSIVGLTLLISVTGFQVHKHTCAEHNYSAVSLIETPVCEKEHSEFIETDDCCKNKVEEIAEPSCCEAAPIDKSNPVSISSQEIECCNSSIESSQMQDNLFPPAEKKIITLDLITKIIPFTEKKNLQTEQFPFLLNNDLPPPKFGKQLLQSIHQLKIDTPIC